MVGNEKSIQNYYNISNGKIVRSFGSTTPEGVETTKRVNKNGVTVFEQNFDFIEGKIINVGLKKHEEYGNSILLTISDNSETAVLQFKFDSSYGRSFLYKLPNLDVSKNVKIKPYSFVDKQTGRNIIGISIFNPLEKVPNFYSKDEPNDMPNLKPIKLKGKDTWDNSEQLEFLYKKFDEFSTKFIEVNYADEVDNGTEVEHSDEIDF